MDKLKAKVCRERMVRSRRDVNRAKKSLDSANEQFLVWSERVELARENLFRAQADLVSEMQAQRGSQSDAGSAEETKGDAGE
jgi:hypothetical protein